jgi:NAD(P)-dependent dehydrogenase (short-subunit alcohol dehydrogenase family)
MSGRTQTKRVFITGGASGLGRAIATRYAREGAKVCIGDLNVERGEETRAALAPIASDMIFIRCDVTREEDLEAVAAHLVDRWGGVDLVVNNAGVAQAGPIEDVPLSDWSWIIDINLLGVVRGTKVFTPLFKRQGHGHFVNVASMAGLLDVPNMSAYNATKAAVVSLSETLHHELEPANIGVTLVCPSFFKTNLAESLRTTDPRLKSAVDRLLGRPGITADDVASAIMSAVAEGRFYVLPHVEGARAWTLKRILPRDIYASIFRKSVARMQRETRTKA